jgi:hypothetical protein
MQAPILVYSMCFDNLIAILPFGRMLTTMRISFLVLLFCSLVLASWGQSGLRIDTSNYYGYARDGGSFDWIRTSDAVPVIIEEIRNAGFSNAFLQVGRLVRLDKNTVFVVTVHWEGEKPFGYIYEEGHSQQPNVADRHFMQDEYRDSYSQAELGSGGELKYQKVGKLPRNIFLLRERCYWFQSDDTGGNYPVSKDVAIRILRQDIRAYLNRMMATRR